MKQSTMRRFWEKVDRSTGECWRWTAAMNDRGYAQLWIDGKVEYAHRFAFECFIGDIPAGLYVDHLCHTPNCVNPDHLRLATNKQNQEHRQGAQANSSSGIRGVSRNKLTGKWEAYVNHHGKRRRRSFAGREDAAAQASTWRAELFTHDTCELLPEGDA